ncbi:inhibitor of nuclear factor kappa-B kinase subunit beta [Hippocampus comes]|uniref:inhibitor of nuclear factor kappa-B kinase subunit beta n=1 Tax=Hippocampus comes TaxID=109280 RepID=UPI00094EA325|nr:PREDICTED: inhibitor of nuclear factor kappa-B kinase subunit beta-like [Hippocampus comes]
MNRVPLHQPQSCGPWELKERLGTGGFGNVTRWQNKDTEEQIAIKQCRQELSERNKERWCLEIQIMKRLDHVNVVAAREVPEGMQKLVATNDLPLLAMEYCQGGDLRKYLNLLENCCGMREGSVLILLCDISSALTYLHKKRIIHRDLKPENIVLQQGEKRVSSNVPLAHVTYAQSRRTRSDFRLLPSLAFCFDRFSTTSLSLTLPKVSELEEEMMHLQQDILDVQRQPWRSGEALDTLEGKAMEMVRKLREKPKEQRCSGDGQEILRLVVQAMQFYERKLRDFYTHLSLLAEKLERWLRLMLKWSPQEPPMVQVLNMTTAKILRYAVTDEETVAELQKRIEEDTSIPAAKQELLLEAGLALEPHGLATQCAIDYTEIDGRRTDFPLIFLFDRSSCSYEPPLTPRSLPENICFVQKDPKHVLPYSPLRRTCAQAWHTIRSLKEDWQRLQQGQKAAIMSLLRHNSSLSKQKNEMVSMHQRLMAKLDFFTTSLHTCKKIEMWNQFHSLASEKLLGVWREMEQTAGSCGQPKVSELEEEMMHLQQDILDVQRQPWRSGEALDTLEGKAMEMVRKLREKPKEQRCSGDGQEILRLVVQAMQFYERKLRDFYTHLSKTGVCRQRVMELLPKVEGVVQEMAESEQVLMGLQEKRQRELWNLLKVACSKVRSPVSGSPDGSRTPSSVPPLMTPRHSLQQLDESLVEESRTFESRLQSLLHDTIQESESSMEMLREWTWLQGSNSFSRDLS